MKSFSFTKTWLSLSYMIRNCSCLSKKYCYYRMPGQHFFLALFFLPTSINGIINSVFCSLQLPAIRLFMWHPRNNETTEWVRQAESKHQEMRKLCANQKCKHEIEIALTDSFECKLRKIKSIQFCIKTVPKCTQKIVFHKYTQHEQYSISHPKKHNSQLWGNPAPCTFKGVALIHN